MFPSIVCVYLAHEKKFPLYIDFLFIGPGKRKKYLPVQYGGDSQE